MYDDHRLFDIKNKQIFRYVFEIKVDNYDQIYGIYEEEQRGTVLEFEDEKGVEAAIIHGNHIIDPALHPHALKKIIGVIKRRAEAALTPETDENKK